MDLSVVIVSFNAKEFLRHCLASVKKASESVETEIFVVDNNSADGSAEMVKTEFQQIHLIQNNVNSGFSAACNQAIRLSSGDYILLMNPDTIIPENTLDTCVSFMREHVDAGALGVRMINGDGTFLPESKRALPTPMTSFFKITGISRLLSESAYFNRYYLPQIGNREISNAVEVISGAFMLISRNALKRAGLPDEKFFMYGEDIDLSYRILKAGFKNYYYGPAEIIHFKGKSTPRNSYQDIFHFYNAMRIYISKRNAEKFSLLYYLIIPAIFLREFLALSVRFFRIVIK